MTKPILKNANANFRGHIPGLDALRAVGIFVVMLNHTFPRDLFPDFTHLLDLGWAFMDFFFVMSGFLITGILLDTRSKPHALRTFFVRRALRILPAYYVVIGVLLVLAYLNRQTITEWGSPLWFLVYLGNFPTAFSGDWPDALDFSFTPLWSLQIEEQFYLIFPFLVFGLRPATLRRVLMMLIPISFGLRLFFYLLWPHNDLVQYVLLPSHMEGLALGALIAIRYRSGNWEINPNLLSALVVLLLLATGIVGKTGGWEHNGALIRTVGFLVSSLAGAALVIWLIEFRNSRVSVLFAWKPIQYFGKISYGLYLVHFPIGALIAWLYPGITHGRSGVIFSTVVIGLSISIAALSWRFMEEPLLRWKNRLTKSA